MLKKESSNLEIDNLDIDILKQLMQDATKPYTEIAKETSRIGNHKRLTPDY
jgi:Lrp/AsnC family transcriptional regulator for asnA, asnC and gidA